MELAGTILYGPDFEALEGIIRIRDGVIDEVTPTDVDSDAIIAPTFVNAHTHLGDSIAKEAGRGLSLEDLVAPPDGLKHRLLRDAGEEALIEGMRRSLSFAIESATAACYDFREGGVDGVAHLRQASERLPIDAYAFARESIEAMEAGDGYGASGANDADFADERAATREAGKPFAIHAGEPDSSDIDPALDLEPDVLIHVVHPESHHLDRIESTRTPVVCCPRSNLVTGVGLPPFEALHERTTLALGTDNVMLNSPSMFREMAVVSTHSDLTAPEVLRMATHNGAAILGRDDGLIEPGRPANLFVLDGSTNNLVGVKDPVRAVVRRAGPADVDDVVIDGTSVIGRAT
ncbi:amidohydrolase family protein [Halovivax gelatinilyticus]|uniref:amidohydrolase family protein n=1 Tax=Halovivax gelatinilyticus TaxID=2961597 RepID=UPI0020CA3817|nr:amidohydrolase family protein [Halovivax gelatinilyticus]